VDGAEGGQGERSEFILSLDRLSTGRTDHPGGEGARSANSTNPGCCAAVPVFGSPSFHLLLRFDQRRKQFAFKHSSRNRPLKLSTRPFCIGRPG
jgi:hypothetical protein